jgi:hypothetical protein
VSFLFTKSAIVIASVLTLCGISCYPIVKDELKWPQVLGAHNSKEKVDLKVDSVCHYYQYDPQNPRSFINGELAGYFDAGCFFNNQPFGNWDEKDLCREKFFNFADLKPGDRGEDTISLHVYGRNACGTWEIYQIKDSGNDCTEPETQTQDKDCQNKTPGAKEKNGELMENLEFKLWLDQGETVGFQGKDNDPLEGDNLFNGKDYLIFDWEKMDRCPQKMPLWYALRQIRKNNKDLCNQSDRDGDGNTNYGVCHGIARDGHLVKSAVYYYGFAWRFPANVGNEAQTDSLSFNMRFQVVPDDRCTSCSNPCDSCHRTCSDCSDRCNDCIPERCECSR